MMLRSLPPLALLLGCLPLSVLAADPAPPDAPTPAPPEIRMPAVPLTPRINGPRVYGARPGHPFFYHVPVTGERPMRFEAKGLPGGLMIDPATGNVTGAATEHGMHSVEFTATNARGIDKATINVVVGDTISLTPTLGWNSWNHFSNHVTEKDVRAAADAMAGSGLIDHGWTYVNVDDCWQGGRDPEGNIHGNEKFPEMKALADYVHGKGLKFGLYSSPGPKTCAGFAGSYGHEDQDARTYAGWGVDYVKYDLCSYGDIMRDHLRDRVAALLPEDKRAAFIELTKQRDDLMAKPKRDAMEKLTLKEVRARIASYDSGRQEALLREEQQIPYRTFGQSLAKVPRDIIYSFCQYGKSDVWEWGASLGGNSWRTTGDISANWKSMSGIGFNQDRPARFAGPGHWNDPDMLEVGNAGLTPDECYTHMTLWCMLSAPLLLGCDLSRMDPFTVSLFSNDEVLAVDQDALGKQGSRIHVDGTTETWTKPLVNGATAVALFNRGEAPVNVSVSMPLLAGMNIDLGGSADAKPLLRDLWRQKNLGALSRQSEIVISVAPHGAELIEVITKPVF